MEHEGLEAVQKVPGYRDAPLGGDRNGQRSIRLSRAYRAFYVIKKRIRRGCGSDRSEQARLLNDTDQEKASWQHRGRARRESFWTSSPMSR
jgi:hypothetical protein